ncbi:MAG: ABC transporter ATP-binding protein [Acidimicrobiales bacterium]
MSTFTPRDDDTSTPIVEVRNLTVSFGVGANSVRAVEEVSLRVQEGDIVALVGESGCGKSTFAAALLDIIPAPGQVSAGEVLVQGRSLATMTREERRHLRGATVAMVFQSAMNAFNPVLTIGDQVDHILRAHPDVFATRREGREYFAHVLDLVRLDPVRINSSYESQLSGGMKQRVAIAVAVLLKPKVVVLDEPTTALDVWNQRIVISILRDLHRTLGITIVLVTHDLAVVAEMATKVAVMYAGRLVEFGTVEEIFKDARRHPYVVALVGAIPSVLEGGLAVRPIPGQVPNLTQLPEGCRFAPRCALAEPRCRDEEPALIANESGHLVACHVVNSPVVVPR